MILSKNNKQNKKQKQIMAKSRLEVSEGEGEGVEWMGIWGIQTVLSGKDGQWDPTAQHREMCVIGSLTCSTELDETL